MHISTRKSNSRLHAVLTLGVVALSVVGVEAQNRTTQAGEASIKDAKKECQPYNYPPVTVALASFPTIWGPAAIVPGDGNAEAKWASIQPNVPDIPPKGTLEGNFDGLNYPADDPDCWWTNTKCNKPKVAGVPEDVSIMPEPRTLGYGFDDGPNCSHNAFYDYLASQRQKATMFYIGSNVMDWPLEAQRAVADGHEICIHGWSHRYMTGFQSEDAFAELYYKMQAVKIATGVTPTCWRPPYGDVDDRIRAIANGLGLRTVMWKYDSQDWQLGVTPGVTTETVDKEYQAMVDDAKKGMFDTVGTMILAHEINAYTMDQAMKWYPMLKKAFTYIVPVSVGMNITQPYVERNVTMPNFAQYIAGTGASLSVATNATNATMPTGATAPIPVGKAPVSPSTVGQVPETTPKTADASRLEWKSGVGGIKVIVAVAVGFACAVAVGLPHN